MTEKEIFSFQDGLRETARRAAKTDKPFLVAVAGGSCAGKSYFAEKLADELYRLGELTAIIEMDMYFKDISDPNLPRDEKKRVLFDRPDSYAVGAFKNDTGRLLSGLDVVMPNYDKKTNKKLTARGKTVKAAPVVIADGLYAIQALADFRRKFNVFVETFEGIRLWRRIERDVRLYAVSPRLVEQVFREKVIPCEKEFLERQKAQADFIVIGYGRR
jgi:uridine kinase